jgi:hypothetical protein
MATLVLSAISYDTLRLANAEIAADLKAQRCDPEIEIHPNLPELYGRGSGFDVVTVLRRA